MPSLDVTLKNARTKLMKLEDEVAQYDKVLDRTKVLEQLNQILNLLNGKAP